MAKNTTSKLSQMATGQQRTQKAVFGKNLFPGGAKQMANENETRYVRGDVAMEDLVFTEDVDLASVDKNLKQSILEYLVSPIVLKQEYEEAERGGRKFRKKTGKFLILDGNVRASIYKEAGREEIFALILPLDISKEEEQRFILQTKEKGVAVATNEVETTTEGEITNCYRYEIQEVDEQKLEERENKYSILESEVEALADSILNVGLLQPIVVLPELDSKSQIHYIIQAGHKRVKAIRKLKKDCQNPDSRFYIYRETIVSKFATVPALIIPSGATQQEIEQIYNETNLLSRHMTTEDVFAHIACIGPEFKRPETQREFDSFMGRNKKMVQYVADAQAYFKKLGFKDWANSKTAYFLNVHFYGSDKAVELFEQCGDTSLKKEERPDLTQKEVYWVVIHNNTFEGREEQTRILEEALQDKTTLLQLMAEATPSRSAKSIKIKKLNQNIVKQKTALEKMRVTPLDRVKNDMADLARTLELIEETQDVLTKFQEEIKKLQ